jgi:hypothetical protein
MFNLHKYIENVVIKFGQILLKGWLFSLVVCLPLVIVKVDFDLAFGLIT